MKEKIITISIIAVLFIAVIGSFSYRSGRKHNFHKLQLTENQIQQMQAIRKQIRTETKAIREDMEEQRRAFMEEIKKESPDQNKLAEIKNKMKAIQLKRIDLQYDSIIKTRGVLTPEQVQKAQEMLKVKNQKRGLRRHLFGKLL